MSNPTGTIDLNEKDLSLRNYIFETAKNILKLRGATQIETPVIELLETVEKMYGGEFNKLVYNINDDGQKLILRYDLTVPLARYVGSNGISKLKRFQYGKVYRRDNPQIQKGRYREFYQFDYDIVGDDQNSNSNDLEMLETMNTILNSIIGKNTYTTKINYKNIVIELLAYANIEANLFSTVFSSLDKLDKKSFNEIKNELIQKNISNYSIDKLEKIYLNFQNKNNQESLNTMKDLNIFSANNISYLENIMSFLFKLNIDNFIIDPFLIRGMDYYTGIIFEVTYNDKNIMESTISAGGRYDDMIEKFSTRGRIPAIGMSLGVERIAKILELTTFKNNETCKTPDIFVATVGKNMTTEKILLASKLRQLGYYTVFSDLAEPDMRQQFATVFEKYNNIIPVMIVIGEKEINNNVLTIKDINKKVQKVIQRNDVDLTNIINEIIQSK